MKKLKIILSIVFFLILAIAGLFFYNNNNNNNNNNFGSLTLGVYSGEQTALIWIAQNQSYFLKNKLNISIKEYASGKLAVEDLLKNNLDMATASEYAFVRNSFNYSDLRILSRIDSHESNFLVARKDKGINSLSDLSGKTIAIPFGTSVEYEIANFFLINGLNYSNIKIINLDSVNIGKAIINGSIDAGVTFGVPLYNLKKELNESVTFWSIHANQNSRFLLISNKRIIESKQQAIEGLIFSLFEAENFVKNNPETAKKIIADKFGYSTEYVDNFWNFNDFSMRISQELLILLESQARWMISKNMTNATKIPNYLNYLSPHALEKINPSAVTITI